MDFGLAKSSASSMTNDGSLLGTPNYMSPEQIRGDELDGRSDLFSLGVVLWEALAGRRLFKRDSELETLQAIVDEAIPDLRSVRADAPVSVTAIVTCALAKERDARFSSADELRRALLAAAPRPDPTSARARRARVGVPVARRRGRPPRRAPHL